MNENMQEGLQPFEGKLDISHIVSVIMDQIGGIIRIPAKTFTSSMTVDRKLIIEYDPDGEDFIITVEQGLIGEENSDEQPSN